jgi:hypothetical protein
MSLRKILTVALITTGFTSLRAQLQTTGYVGLMPSHYYYQQAHESYWNSLLHNRINLNYGFSRAFTGVLQVRTRLLWGRLPGYATLLDTDNGWADLSVNMVSKSSAILNTTIDRLWFDLTEGPLQFRIGRQRINWGQAMVWNPNDLFNAYSFFDFDYPERPGIDGLRVQYYSGTTSLSEGVFKIDRLNRKTMALRHRFNAGGYDWQLMGGRLNDSDWVGGMGWSGHLKNAGFYGEVTNIIPDEKGVNSILVTSMGADYTFPNSLSIRMEMLYSSNLPVKTLDFSQLITGEASVKNLSVARYSCFASVQYPFTPLFSGSLSGMFFPGSFGWYLGPTLEYSLKNNLFLSFYGNLFRSNTLNSGPSSYMQETLRLKWHF